MIESVEEGVVYQLPSGIRFVVNHKARHAQDCSVPMVVYTNLEATADTCVGQKWVIEESLFLKHFREAPNG